jgi:ABC-type phosphate transport system substrate-binding protein
LQGGRGLVFILVTVIAVSAAIAEAHAQTAFQIIVHPDNPISSLDRKFLADVFLKKKTRWSDDSVIRPVDLTPKSAARRRFSEEILRRSVDAVRSYWRQVIYSGRGVPPPELDTDTDIVSFVRQNKKAIGYVSGGADTDGVKVLQVK